MSCEEQRSRRTFLVEKISSCYTETQTGGSNYPPENTRRIFFQKGSWIMRLEKVQDALNKKNIKFEYTEEDGCGSLDFMFRGLKFHVWEYEDNGWGAETNIYAAGRSEDIDGDYEEKISAEILSWPDMINN